MNQNDFASFISPKKLLQLQLPEGMDASLAENINDTFMTADESGNTTQFFSVLESSSATILDNISYDNLVDEHEFTFTNASQSETSVSEKHSHSLSAVEATAAEEAPEESLADQELIIFKSPLCSKLFGLQTTQDEDGNMQKYQYEVLQNDDGQYESIPGTIHLVPYDTDPASVIKQMEMLQEQTSIENISNNNDEQGLDTQCQVFIKEENNAEKEVYITGMVEQDDDVTEDENLCLHLESKPGADVEQCEEEDPLEQSCSTSSNYHVHATEQVEDTINESEGDEDNESPVAVKQGILESALKGIYSPATTESESSIVYVDEAQLMVAAPDLEEEEEQTQEEAEPEPEPMIHIQSIQNGSGHRTIALYPMTNQSMQMNKVVTTIELPLRHHRTKYIMTHGGSGVFTGITAPLKSLNSLKRSHGSNILATAVANAEISPQKENLRVTKRKPSNVIKRSYTRRSQNKLCESTSSENPVSAQTEAAAVNETEIDVDWKEPVLEEPTCVKEKRKPLPWNVNKMISQTKIIEAPVRQERLPRKQKIKPLERLGEELEFQHVTVTASGVIETMVDGVVKTRKVLQPSECIHLSDTEDEFARKTRKRNSKKKQIEIVISDSEEEPQERTRSESRSDTELSNEDVPEKEVNTCPKCSKSFPSIGSLKTHLQSHTLEESQKTQSAQKKDADDQGKSRHSCSVCPEKFINAFLRNKHEQLHKARTRIECAVCKRLFSNAMQLNAHKKTHAKGAAGAATAKATAVPEAERRSTRSSAKTAEAVATTSRQPATSAPSTKVPKAQEPKSPVKKTRVSVTLKRRSAVPTLRKSLMPPPGAALTRRTLLPSKMPAATPTGTTHMKTRASVAPSSLPQPSTRPAVNKVFRCLSCKSSFPNKLALDSHIIKSCVKSPRRPSTSTKATLEATTATTKRRSKSCSTTMLHRSFAPIGRGALQSSKSTQSLNRTVGAASAQGSARGARSASFVRRRIPTNAGIPMNARMHSSLMMNIKRKLMEDSDDETDADADNGDHGDSKDRHEDLAKI